MFGLSFGEIVIIAIVALLLLGPDRLPDAAKTLGKGLREIRKATDDIRDQVEQEIYPDLKKPARPSLVPPVPAAAPVPGPAAPPPAASSDNLHGLDAALFEPSAPEGPAPAPAAAAPAAEAAPAPAAAAPAAEAAPAPSGALAAEVQPAAPVAPAPAEPARTT